MQFFTELYFHTAALPLYPRQISPNGDEEQNFELFIYICLWFERYVPVMASLLLSACVGKDTYRDIWSVFLECHMHELVQLLLGYLQSTLFILRK